MGETSIIKSCKCLKLGDRFVKIHSPTGYFFRFIYYFWLCLILIDVHGLSLVAVSGATL